MLNNLLKDVELEEIRWSMNAVDLQQQLDELRSQLNVTHIQLDEAPSHLNNVSNQLETPLAFVNQITNQSSRNKSKRKRSNRKKGDNSVADVK